MESRMDGRKKLCRYASAAAAAFLCLGVQYAAAQVRGLPLGTGGRAPREGDPFPGYYFSAGGAAAVPIGGHWGDGDSGFGPAPAFSLAGAKKVDDLLSYGAETGYGFGHKNLETGAMRVRIFHLTPFFRISSQSGDRTYYGIFGAGIYHWTQPAFDSMGVDYDSDSGSSFGFTLGGGAVFPLRGRLKLGTELRWHRLFTMKGDNFDVDLANNIQPSVLLLYGF